jgi:hypothetical protein
MEANDRIFRFTTRGIFTLCATLFVVLILWISTGYPPRARYVPQVVGIVGLICLLFQLVLDFFPGLVGYFRRVEKEDGLERDDVLVEQASADGPESRLEWIAYAWLLVLLAGLVLVGFLIFIPIYVLFYLRFQAQLSWIRSMIYGIGTWLFVYLLFVYLFEIRLYPGLLIEPFLDF